MSRSVELLCGAAYVALITGLIYGVVDWGASNSAEQLAVVFLLGASLAVGLAAPRWWVFLLPLALVFIAIPAGYSPPSEEYVREEITAPIWVWLPFGLPFLEVIVAVGVPVGWLGRRLAARSS